MERLRVTLLCALVALLWCVAYGRTSRAAWATPVSYYGDGWQTLATLKTAHDGHVSPFMPLHVPELGAPYVGNWNDFPNFLRQHKLQLWLAGGLCRLLGLFAAANLLLLLAHVLAACSFYAVARYFRARPEWAAAGALVFAFSAYLFYRSLDHLNLSFCWPIPFAILLVSWAFGRRGIEAGSRRFWTGLAIVAVAGIHNVYYASLLGQFLLLAGFAQLLRGRSRTAVLGPWLLLLALCGAVLADSANVIASNARQGSGLARHVRPYGNVERYALKPIELLLPGPGRVLASWPSLATTYWQGALYRGEMGSAYLGLAGIAGLAWMCLASFRGYVRRQRSFLPGAALAVIWILAYSVVGGFNGLVGAAGFTWFRGTNRYSVWILAVILLWTVGRLSRARWTRRRAASFAAAALVSGISFADQRPPGDAAAQVANARESMTSDRTFAHSLETALPAGAMVFMLPVVDCPEGARVLRATDYEHFRPYLFSRQLRFSYGSDKGRARDDWQRRVESLDAVAMAEALERIGFSAIVVNRRGYPDGAQALRGALAASGRPEAWESPDHDFLFVRLAPVPIPQPPDAVVPPADVAESP